MKDVYRLKYDLYLSCTSRVYGSGFVLLLQVIQKKKNPKYLRYL